MQRVFIFLYSLFACIFTTNSFAVITSNDPQDANLRILELLPNLLCPLAVDPGIPADFIALSPRGTLNPYDWIYWGPKDVLKAYFDDPTSLKVPVIRVKLSAEVSQTGQNSFNKSFMRFLKMVEQKDPKGFASIETQWGDYPILAVRTQVDGKLVFSAWVDLKGSRSWLDFGI